MKQLRLIAVFAVLGLLLCSFAGCHKEGEDVETSAVEATISDSIPVSETWEMHVGETKEWIPFDDAEEDVVFRNSDIRFIELRPSKSTATIRAIDVGEATLTADWGDKHYRVQVVVKKAMSDEVSVVVYDLTDESKVEDEVPS